MRFIALLCFLALTACATRFHPADLPQLDAGEIHTFRLDRLDDHGKTIQSSILVVQGTGQGSSRWVQSDVFGAPQARLVASENGWRRDGFIPPNPEAERLFGAMFPLLRNKPHEPQRIQGWLITPLESP